MGHLIVHFPASSEGSCFSMASILPPQPSAPLVIESYFSLIRWCVLCASEFEPQINEDPPYFPNRNKSQIQSVMVHTKGTYILSYYYRHQTKMTLSYEYPLSSDVGWSRRRHVSKCFFKQQSLRKNFENRTIFAQYTVCSTVLATLARGNFLWHCGWIFR